MSIVPFYYDYAGGTYYVVKLCWFFDCPDDLEARVWTNGVKTVWHIHGSNNSDGEWCESKGYHAEIPTTDKLRDYFQANRHWQNLRRDCKTKEERIACGEKLKNNPIKAPIDD